MDKKQNKKEGKNNNGIINNEWRNKIKNKFGSVGYKQKSPSLNRPFHIGDNAQKMCIKFNNQKSSLSSRYA